MVKLVRHRPTKGAVNGYAEPKAHAPHLYSTPRRHTTRSFPEVSDHQPTDDRRSWAVLEGRRFRLSRANTRHSSLSTESASSGLSIGMSRTGVSDRAVGPRRDGSLRQRARARAHEAAGQSPACATLGVESIYERLGCSYDDANATFSLQESSGVHASRSIGRPPCADQRSNET